MARNARNLITKILNSASVSSNLTRRPKNLTPFPFCNTFSSHTHNADDKVYKHEIGGTRILLDADWCGLLIEHYIKKASKTEDKEISSKAFNDAKSLLLSMKGMSFEVKENYYEPLMRFVIERQMTDDFRMVYEHFRKEHHNHVPKLSYYETLLLIKSKDEDNIQRLLLKNDKGTDESVGYMEALSEEGRMKEVLMILTTFDILKVSSHKNMETLFKSLGKLQLESHAKSFILKLKATGKSTHVLSNLICIYAISIPMLQIQDTVERFNSLHAELNIKCSAVSFRKLIETSCDMREVSLALKLAGCMLKENLRLDVKTFDSILTACDKNCDYHLVKEVHSMVINHGVLPNLKMLKMMINIFIKMNKFEEAYDMINSSKEFGLDPNASMYNAIISGHLRMNEFDEGVAVLEKMDESNVKPDAYTFRLIISHCSTEELIIKYLNKCEDYQVPLSKQVILALVSAYISSGLVDKAKQVLENKQIPSDDLREIKSMLVSELAMKGHISDALAIYDDMRQNRENLEPKAVLALIQHGQDKCELHRLVELLNQLEDYDLWMSGCDKIISFCVRHKLLSWIVDLLKQRMQKATNDIHTECIFDGAFVEIAEMEPVDIQFGMDLLRAVREDLGIEPPRQCLDLLLTASVKAKEGAELVWKEYELAGLPYNSVTYLGMHQALLASGQYEQAELLLQNKPKSHGDRYMDPLFEANKSTFGCGEN